MHRISSLLITLLLTFFCLADAERPILKIGIIAPMSGDASFIGEDVRNGATLALEDIGDTGVKYDLIYEDNQNVNRLSNEAAQKLIHIDKADIIYSLWTNGAEIVGPLAERSHIIQFNTGWEPEAARKYHWTLVYGASYEDFAAKSVALFKQAGCKRVAIAEMLHVDVIKVVDAALPLFKKEGIQIVFNEPVTPDLRDFRTWILKIRSANPDGLWEPYWDPPQDAIFHRQMRELQYRPVFMTGYYDFFSPDLVRNVDNSYYPSELWAKDAFTKHFKERFGHPFLSRAAHIYDMTTIVIKTTEGFYSAHHRLPSHEELLALLKTPRELSDLMVGPGRMHSDGWIEVPFAIREIKNGKIVEAHL
jgi:branched-chain amino acid transport system substrate-binding protein